MNRLRDEKRRLNMEAYALNVEIRASYADVDSFCHLNNVAIARYFEEGRASLNIGVFGADVVVRPSGGVQLLFARVEIDYLAQGDYPGKVSVGTAVSRIGRSSFTQSSGLFQKGECLALCEATTVFAMNGRATELSPTIKAALELLQLRN